VHRDYAPKGVKFYFIYKSLAHPELAGNYVQPFTMEERLAHANQAERQLGASIPWIVDAMDNRLKHALGNRPNSEFVIDPSGVIVRKRAWSDPIQLRNDLTELVGPVEPPTREEDIQLKMELPVRTAAPRGTVPRLKRPAMQAIVMEPQITEDDLPFFAKLRAEADAALLRRGSGQLYLGFHLDPFHNAHWNNLTQPLSVKLELPDGAEFESTSLRAAVVDAVADSDPREFLIDVSAWPDDEPVQLTVRYFACVGEEACYMVRQQYVIRRQRDPDGGGARGEGAGFWDADEFAARILEGDQNGDGKVDRSEVSGILLPHFEKLDSNADGLLDAGELQIVAEWLNNNHSPGIP